MGWRTFKPYKWACRITCETHAPSGKRVTMDRIEEGAGDVLGAVKRALASRKDGGSAFLGCDIRFCTPLGQTGAYYYDPDTYKLRDVNQ